MWIQILVLLILFILWNTTLVGYKDKWTLPIDTDDSKAFCEEAKSIVLTRGSRTAILLVHGFPSTPAMYSYSAQRFLEAGMDVHAPLLPGFGADPKQFVRTTFTQWFDYLCRYYERLRSEYDTLYVLGTSMGGMMTLKLAERYCGAEKEMDKIVTIAAPVVYNSIKEGVFTDPLMYIGRTVALFAPSIKAKIVAGNGKGDDGAEVWYGYGGVFVRPGLSLINAMKLVHKDLDRITCPLFAIHDTNDRTVPFKNLSIIKRLQRSREFRLLETTMGDFNHSHHALLSYHSIQRQLTDTILEFLLDKEIKNAQT